MHAYAYVCACMRVYVHVYMYICMSVYMYAYTFIYARVWVYICTRVGAFLFICTFQFLYYMHVYYRCFLALACVCGGGLEVGFVSVCSWLGLVTGVGDYVLVGVEIGVLSCIFLYFCGY